jgi:hypothetical protein
MTGGGQEFRARKLLSHGAVRMGFLVLYIGMINFRPALAVHFSPKRPEWEPR